MGDGAQAALVTGIFSLLIGTGPTLRWWIERRDAQRKAKQAEATRELSESEAEKTIRTLERQNAEYRAANDILRRELHQVVLQLAECVGGKHSEEDVT